MNNLADGGPGVAAFAAAATSAGAAGGVAAALSGAFGAGAAGGVAAPQTAPAQGTSVDAFTRGLQATFGFPTDWNFSGSSGAGAGLFVFSGGGGTIDFSQAGVTKGGVSYRFLGGTIGLDGGPDFTFTFSTPTMWSAGVGNIRSRTADPLTLDDFAGPMFIFSFTATSPVTPTGKSMTIYMLGVPTIIAVGGLLYPPMMLSCASQAANTAKAIGVMLGDVVGVDASVTIAPGYARLR